MSRDLEKKSKEEREWAVEDTNVLVVGLGEVGRPIADLVEAAGYKLYTYTRTEGYKPEKPKKTSEDVSDIDIIHICTPYTESFEDYVSRLIDSLPPELVIIHSTVKTGATERITSNLRNDNYPVIVHSPIRGNHDDMLNDIKTKFVKFVGAENDSDAELACTHLSEIGIEKVKWLGTPRETELGKLMETTWYGVNIAFMQEVQRLCDFYQTDFKKVLTDFSKDGFFDRQHSMPRPWKMYPGEIGGHCVMPNIDLLMMDTAMPLIAAVKASNDTFKETQDVLRKIKSNSDN